MTDVAAPLPALKRHKPFALFWVMRVATAGAYLMQSVAIGWQIYDMTGNPLDLGLVGLVQFFPLVALAVVVGQIIDRYDRRLDGLRRRLRRGERAGEPAAARRAPARKKAGDARQPVCRVHLCPPPSCPARGDLARPVRGHARRRDGAAADLCARRAA